MSVSLPSLRLDSFSVGLADRVADVRRSGLTFAPEAASPRLRALINKWIPDAELLGMAEQAYGLGWNHVKLYFMIGLPTERDDDIEAIAELTLRTLRVGRSVNRRARVNLGISTFVPKPFTPFQWAPQITIAETHRRQGILEQRFGRNPGIKFGRHGARETFLEGLLTRGDRRTADLIEAAFRNGARLDAWREHLDFAAWELAIEQLDFDVAEALRERELDERLPWDHIDVHIPKRWFQEDWQRALELKHAQDCRHHKCHRCGVIDVERELCASMLRDNIEGRKSEALHERTEKKAAEAKPAVQRLRFRVGRVEDARFLGHLEAMNAWIRALRRAGMPLCYSQGFHAHPRVNFAAALPTGEESTGEYMDIFLREPVDVAQAMARLASVLPRGFLVLAAADVPLKAKSLMASVEALVYSLITPADDGRVASKIQELNAATEIPIMRSVKTRDKRQRRGRRRVRELREVDLKPMIQRLAARAGEGGVVIELVTVQHEGRFAKPKELVQLLGLDPLATRILKRDTVLAGGNKGLEGGTEC